MCHWAARRRGRIPRGVSNGFCGPGGMAKGLDGRRFGKRLCGLALASWPDAKLRIAELRLMVELVWEVRAVIGAGARRESMLWPPLTRGNLPACQPGRVGGSFGSLDARTLQSLSGLLAANLLPTPLPTAHCPLPTAHFADCPLCPLPSSIVAALPSTLRTTWQRCRVRALRPRPEDQS
jgi:hypothetical protein